jgi:hypothetical protein
MVEITFCKEGLVCMVYTTDMLTKAKQTNKNNKIIIKNNTNNIIRPKCPTKQFPPYT